MGIPPPSGVAIVAVSALPSLHNTLSPQIVSYSSLNILISSGLSAKTSYSCTFNVSTSMALMFFIGNLEYTSGHDAESFGFKSYY